jgi:hypothetical protein
MVSSYMPLWFIACIAVILIMLILQSAELFTKAEPIDNFKHYLNIYEPPFTKVRVGSEHDGGYVICNGLEYDCFLSAGVSDNTEFEDAFLDKHQHLTCYTFDGSVDELPSMRNSDRMVFHKLYIGGSNSETHTNMRDFFAQYTRIMVKMDIEGGEFEWISSLTSEDGGLWVCV